MSYFRMRSGSIVIARKLQIISGADCEEYAVPPDVSAAAADGPVSDLSVPEIGSSI